MPHSDANKAISRPVVANGWQRHKSCRPRILTDLKIGEYSDSIDTIATYNTRKRLIWTSETRKTCMIRSALPFYQPDNAAFAATGPVHGFGWNRCAACIMKAFVGKRTGRRDRMGYAGDGTNREKVTMTTNETPPAVPMANDIALLVDANEAARMCSMHRGSWYKIVAAGKTPASIRIGSMVRWRRDEIEEWIAAGCPPRAKWDSLQKKSPTKFG